MSTVDETDATADELPLHSQRPKSAAHGYSNKVNRLVERRISVTDGQGKPAVREGETQPFQDVELTIVWTAPEQNDWNYSLPELHGGKGILEMAYPSQISFLETKLEAKRILEVSVPDTPYSFYIIDGSVTPYFCDSEKLVIWQLKNADLESAIRQMNMISVTSKRIMLSPYAGDVGIIFAVDFSHRTNSPKITYSVEYHGP